MKILLLHTFNVVDQCAKFDAVSYYRMVKPNQVLNRLYPEIEFHHVLPNDEGITDEVIKDFDLVIFCRRIPKDYPERLNKLGIKFGLDLDDYWILPTEHLLYEVYKENNEAQVIIDSIRAAHFVTCTTSLLAKEIQEYNKNVYVIENGIDTEVPEWQPNKSPSQRIRYGFTQGSTHLPDVHSIHLDVQKAIKDRKFYSKGQIVLTGWNAKLKEQSIYIGYERMLTDNLKPLIKYEPEYCHQLMTLHTPKETDKPYRRIEALDVYQFPVVYDEFDISVIPLLENKFNSCKSELKLIEAGFKGCAAMVSNVNPYSILMTKENSFSLNEKNFFEWSRYILMNPNSVKDKASQLTEDTKRYEMKLLTDKRKQIYERFK